jgi:solute carrier family 13 (sodium-dependent dicarboxylate transporter), member 2/3/5
MEATAGRARALFGLIAAPLALVVLPLVVAGPHGLLSGLFLFTAILWVTEAIPVPATALLTVALSVLLGLATSKEAFAALGNPILFMFVGGFMLAEAMMVHGLGARVARAVVHHGRGPWGAFVACAGAAFLMSMWVSNSAATAVVLPIALSVARRLEHKGYATAIVLAVAWGASMGGLATPVGTPPNLIGMRALRDAGVDVSFVGWMAVGVPIAVVMFVVMALVLLVMFKLRRLPDVATASGFAPPPWSRGEIAAVVSFGAACVLWIVPGLLDAAAHPAGAWARRHMPEEVVAILVIAPLFVWPIHKRGEPPQRALTWAQATRIDWGTVLLFGSGVLLGDLANKTGLAAVWGRALVDLTGANSQWAIAALVGVAAVILSEIASNTAAATLMVPMALALSQAAQVAPAPAMLAATLCSSLGFMLPVSTAPNAMAYGTGMVRMGEMARVGVVFDLLGVVVVLVLLRVLCPLLGLA